MRTKEIIKKKAIVRAFEKNYLESDKIRNSLIEQGVREPQLLEELTYLMEHEPDKALLKENSNGESIIYVVEPEQSIFEGEEFEELYSCVYSCMCVARDNNIKTIEFPSLGLKKSYDQQMMLIELFETVDLYMKYGFSEFFDDVIVNVEGEIALSILKESVTNSSIEKGGFSDAN